MIRKRYWALGALAAVGLTLVVAASVGAQGGGDRAIFAVMTGAKEVDVNGEHHGDPNGRGTFSATLDGRQLCYGITVKNIENPVAAHIHRGGPKVAGPVIQPLEQPATGDPGASSACVRISRSLARGLRNNPSRFYVNVHTASLPNGAVRGQLFARSR
ncbi:MAG TPA: CHRD domain-containing protein [Thermoleophilaceae bacterium]|nr:CHRD domain-containing protein [Thermoleophilaceae bacterium]